MLAPLLSKINRQRKCHLVVDLFRVDEAQWAPAHDLSAGICKQIQLPDTIDPDTVVGLLDVVFSSLRPAGAQRKRYSNPSWTDCSTKSPMWMPSSSDSSCPMSANGPTRPSDLLGAP